MFYRLDNLDKENVEDVAYFIYDECSYFNKEDWERTKNACLKVYDEFGMYADWEEVWEELEGMLCDMDCNNCEFADKLYFKDNENGEFYEYKTSTIVNCMKYNDFVIGGEFLSNL